MDENEGIDWDQKRKQIKFIEEKINFEELKKFYKNLFAPSEKWEETQVEEEAEVQTINETTKTEVNPIVE